MTNEIDYKPVTSKQMVYSYKGQSGRGIWVHLSDRQLYLSYPTGRTYYIFSKGARVPAHTVSDRTMTIWFGKNHKLEFFSPTLFNRAKDIVKSL